METDQLPEEHIHKKGRHRKKQLYNSILQQMEFYFSDSNLTKDRFLSQLIQSDPFVDVSVFLSFNKIRKLTTNIEDITKAISKSQLIELSEDKTKVRRKAPVKVKENVDECTIYVERLKSDATHDWLTAIFSEFGNVVYVSIPKYKHNGMIKGFAFVEFENEDGVATALEYFESIDCKIPSFMEPDQLCSIATYEGDGRNSMQNICGETQSSEGCSEHMEEESKSKKRKLSVEEEVQHKKTKTNGSEETAYKNEIRNESENELEKKQNEIDMSDGENDEKKKRKLKKLQRKKINLKEIGLQILSKKDWKKMRNRYLDMQRTTMKKLKMHLNRQRFANRYDNYKKYQFEQPEAIQKDDNSQTQIVPGSIVKVVLSEPCEDNKKLKSEVKTYCSEIKFIDIPMPVGSGEIYVRFADNKNAQSFCASKFKRGELSILEGEEEKSYCEKIEMARQTKQKRSLGKQRGRDKLLKKAEKQVAKHVRFDDID